MRELEEWGLLRMTSEGLPQPSSPPLSSIEKLLPPLSAEARGPCDV